MAQKNPKIVLLRDDIDTKDFATHAIKSRKAVDALTVMQTDFVPTEDTVQVNDDGAFFVADLSNPEVKRLEEAPEVLAVVDDEPVYAFMEAPTLEARTTHRFGDGTFPVTYPQTGVLTLDREEAEALERELHPEWNGDEDAPSPERLALLATVKQNGAIDQTLEFKLNDEIHGTAAHSYEYLAEVGEEYDEARRSGEQVARLTRQVVERLLHRLDGDGPVTKQEIDSVLEAVGADDIVRERIAFDVVLPNLRLVNAPPAWRFTKGTRARLAIVDTGIAPRHRDLRVVGGVSYVPGVSSWHDDHGHGTHCAGISAGLMNRRGIVGVAPQADVFAVKVLNRYGSGMKSWVLNGLLWCARFGIHVVNLSLGRRATTHNPATFDAAYEHVGRILRRRGIIAVAAAGNDGHKPVGDPARCPSYMAVSAVDFSRRLTTFTNIGPQVEVCAPGLQILSTVPTGYRRMSGTSMATPHVAGAAALVKSRHPSIHGDSIRLRLMLSATDLGGAGRDWAFGHGLLNAYQAIQ